MISRLSSMVGFPFSPPVFFLFVAGVFYLCWVTPGPIEKLGSVTHCIKLFVFFSEVISFVCWSQDSYPCRVINWRYICRYREGPQGFTMSRLRYRVLASLWAAPAACLPLGRPYPSPAFSFPQSHLTRSN